MERKRIVTVKKFNVETLNEEITAIRNTFCTQDISDEAGGQSKDLNLLLQCDIGASAGRVQRFGDQCLHPFDPAL